MFDRMKRLCSAIELAKLLVLLTACGTLASCNANRVSTTSSQRKVQAAAVLALSPSGGAALATAGAEGATNTSPLGAGPTSGSATEPLSSASDQGSALQAASLPASTVTAGSGVAVAAAPVTPGVCSLLDAQGQPVKAISGVVAIGNDLYFLTPDSLLVARAALPAATSAPALTLTDLRPPGPNQLGGVPIQEFLSLTVYAPHQSVVVLDKSGSLFEFLPKTGLWKLFRANKQTLGTPDPHYISLAPAGAMLLLLDPERNQIWRYPAPRGKERYFREVLPWRVKKGDPWVADAVGLGHDDFTYVLRRRGVITRYPSDSVGGNGAPTWLKFRPPADIRPSKLIVEPRGLLYIVERENNRVLAVNKTDSKYRQFIFPVDSDLRSVLPLPGGFLALSGSQLVWRPHDSADNSTVRPLTKQIDMRLDGLTLPVKAAHLPAHTGVFPGARRLYRHGVHQGLDFFADAGRITMNTPAVAAEAGKVIRADVNYTDMDAKQYSRIMADCERRQFCSDANEDLFRGCQVWIDHGGGLITRYAHLNKARADLKPGMKINRGDVVGYIGVSGTGENVRRGPGHPHLHFEIWLDGHYLGYGLNPAETVGVYEDIFGRIGKRGN
ncbi:MAG: M23 family metallopeptidase [Candidatus Obscuribacterales bacterium]|nr:M23 family metallopeptidase [Candidatus Obscuribacterales bacterium]